MTQRLKCSYADRYQALVAPKCGCQACARKWRWTGLSQAEKDRENTQTLVHFFD